MKSHLYQTRPHVLIICLALILIPFSTAQPQKHIDKIPFQDSLQISASNPRFYSLDLANPPKDLDLLISVLPEGRSCATKLFISKTKEFPQKMNDADYSSVSPSGNILLISHKDLKDTPLRLFIGLHPGDSLCYINVLVEWTKEMKMTANEEKAIVNSNSLISAIVRLTIPKEKDIERIVIHVDALKASMRELLSLEMFINEGTSIPFTKNAESVSRKGAWFEGKKMIISKDSKLFCTDCTLTLSLKFTGSSSISVQAQTFKKSMLISGTATLDAVQKGMKNSYRFMAKDLHKEKGFVLSVKVHQGQVEVLMSCDTRPQTLEDYYWDWSFQIQDFKEIMLGRKGYRCSKGEYFFLVLSEEFSVYSLRAGPQKSNNRLLLGKTTPVTGEISPQEKISYELLVPLFLAGDEVVLNLHEKQSLEVDISICRFPTDCPGLLPATSSFQITNYYGFNDSFPIEEFHYEESTSKSGRIIKISPFESGCYPILVQDHIPIQDPIAVCAYLVTLSNKQSSNVEFSLTSESKGPKLLHTSEPYYEIVARNDAIFYALPISDKSSEAVQLRFTKYFGDFDVFISNSTKYPNHQETPLQIPHEGLLVIKNPSDSEVYYIGVHAAKTSSFSLSAITSIAPQYPPMGMNEAWAFSLSPGKPQKGVWGGKDDYKHYYKFALDQDEDWKGSLCITVNTSSSVWIIVNNNGYSPIIGQANYDPHWSYTEKELVIERNDSKFQTKGVYYIGLYATYAKVAADLAYEITYTLKSDINPTHTFLSPKIPFSGEIEKGESHYFESLLLEDESDLTIYKSGNIELYVSTDPGNKYPSQDSFDFMTKDQLTLSWSEVCKVGNCPVYITVVSKEGSSYSLSMKSGSAAIALEDGQEVQLRTPVNNSHPAVFYFEPSSRQNSVITVACPGKEVVIYAKRTKIGVESLDQLWREAPDENTAEFISEEGVSNITVPRLADSENLAIAVYFKESEEAGQSTFKIMATSKIFEFITDYPYSGNVKKDQYRFFKLKVLRPETALLISLTIENDDGGADLYISYGENTRPMLSNHQFASKTRIIEINNTDIAPLNSMAGYWSLGVYGRTAASFTLTVSYEDQKMIKLIPGIPVEMSLKSYSAIYFQYFHESESHLQINFTKLSDEMDFYITDLVKYLPSKDHHKWERLFTDQQRVITIPMQDPLACVSCLYIMKVEAVSSKSKFSLVVNQLEDILPIQNFLLYNGQLKAGKSAVYMLASEAQETQLNIEIPEEKLIVLGSKSPSINLENYLWKETLAFKQVIPINKSTDFLMLENPTERDVNFNFMITPKTTSHDRLEQIYRLDPNEKKFFEYTCPEDAIETPLDRFSRVYIPVDVNIIFYVAQPQVQESIESFLKKGQQVHARSLPQEATAASKDFIFQAESAPRTRSNESHAIAGQSFSGKMNLLDKWLRIKYLVEVANPWEFPVEFRLDIGQPSPTHTLIPQKDEGFIGNLGYYEVAMKTSGKWYFWVYSCDGQIDLKVENGDPETGMVTIPKGGSYLYKEEIQNNGTKQFVAKANYNSLDRKGKFIMYSSLIDEERLRNYDVKNDSLEVQVSYTIQENTQNNVTVQFEPVEFTDSESNDEIIYQVQFCPERSPQFTETQFCERDESCLNSEVRLSVEQKEIITVDFQRMRPGKYSVKIKVTVIHQNQTIKFIQPYVISYVDFKKPYVEEKKNPIVKEEENKSGFWKIVIGIVALGLVVAAGFIGVKKVRNDQDIKEAGSPGTAGNSLKGFQPLEDEGVEEEDSEIERNGI